MTTPDLSVIILNWNVRELLRACLRSLSSHRASGVSRPATGAVGPSQPGGEPHGLKPEGRRLTTEIIVVDANSSDGSAEMTAREFPHVRLIPSRENLGYSRGNNLGMRAARGRYLLLLNPDTEVVGDALGAMLAFMDAHYDVGVLGPQLRHPDGAVQSSRRRFPTALTAFFESTWLQPLAPPGLLRRFYVLDRPDDETQEVDWVTGACMLIRREAYEQVGDLDEGFFMYSEETDYCRRIKSAGWRVVYFPEARVIHHVGKSSEQAIPERHIRFQRSKIRYFRKHHGPFLASSLRLFLLASYLEQLLLEAAKGMVGHKRELRRQRVAAYWQVLRSGLSG